jgi:hypothetical protein
MDNFASAKRKSGQVLRSKERQIVVNVFNYFKRHNPDKGVRGFDSVTADSWTDCVEHVKRVEAGIWRADEIQDDIEPLIITVNPVTIRPTVIKARMVRTTTTTWKAQHLFINTKGKPFISNNSITSQPQ